MCGGGGRGLCASHAFVCLLRLVRKPLYLVRKPLCLISLTVHALLYAVLFHYVLSETISSCQCDMLSSYYMLSIFIMSCQKTIMHALLV